MSLDPLSPVYSPYIYNYPGFPDISYNNISTFKEKIYTDHEGEKLCLAQGLLRWTLIWATPADIKYLRDGGMKVEDSLEKVSKVIFDSILRSDLSKPTDEEIVKLGKNLIWLNGCQDTKTAILLDALRGTVSPPTSHMLKVKNELRLRQISYNELLTDFSEPKPSNKTAPEITKTPRVKISSQLEPKPSSNTAPQISKPSVFSIFSNHISKSPQNIQNSAEQKVQNADVLLKMRDENFLNFYHNHDFNIQDFILNTYGWKDVFFRLIKLKHKNTIKSLIESPEASQKFYNESLTDQSIREEPAFEAWFSTYKQMMNIRFVPQDKKYELFRTAMFIAENRESMAKNQIGSLSRSREGVLKIKKSAKKGGFKIPFEMDYHFRNGDIIVRLGFLGKGEFRVLNKYLSLGNLRVEAYSKQKIEAQYNLNEDRVKAMAEKEMRILEEFKGVPNVLQLHEYKTYISRKKGKTIVSSQNEFYCLQDLSKSYETLTLLQRKKIACDIIKGVKAIHSKGIIHRDLKLANIFLTKVIDSNGIILKDQNEDEVLEAVVGDFGFACRGTEDPDCSLNAGSRLYMSPQKWANEKSKFADDLWSIGVLLGQLYNKKQFSVPVRTLLNAQNVHDLLLAIDQLNGISLNPEPKNKNSIEYIVWNLLQYDPSKRMNLNEALEIIEKF